MSTLVENHAQTLITTESFPLLVLGTLLKRAPFFLQTTEIKLTDF